MLAGEVSPQEAQDALERVLASPEFAAATRLATFLRYVVTETLEGRAAGLKGYAIAVDVFDRPADFDQSNDPIVRVEASRLRRALAQYYQGSGADDPVIVDLPRGGYVPAFRRRAGSPPGESEPPVETPPAPPDAPPPPELYRGQSRFRLLMALTVGAVLAALAYLVWVTATQPARVAEAGPAATSAPPAAPGPPEGRFQPVIAVTPLVSLSPDEADALIARGLTEELVVELARFQEFVVYDAPDAAALPQSGYAVSGTLQHAGNDIRVTVQLAELPGKRAIWTQTYDRRFEPGQMLAVQDEIASSVATAIGQPYGVVYEREARDLDRRPPGMESYTCVLRVYEYWRVFDPAEHGRARDCLEKAVADDPGYPDAWQMLTFMYLDEYRYGYNARPLDQYRPLDKALETAQRAVALAATDARSYEALYAVYFYRDDIEAFRRAGADARRLNPNSPEIMADFGNKLVAMGAYDEGAALIRKALTLNPAHPGWYNIGLVLEAYRRGAYDEALAAVARMNLPLHYPGWVFITMIHGQRGDAAEARAAAEELLRLQPDFPLNARSDFRKWGYRPELTELCIAGLRKAGLDIADP